MKEVKKRQLIIDLCRQMNATGLNQGTSGNISALHKGNMLITPSGVPYEDLEPEHIASLPLEAEGIDYDGPLKPSSEWHFHRAILQSNPEFGAVVHTHSMFATILSIANRDIPACHYMVAAFGGNTVRCAQYATFGTPALSTHIVAAMQGRWACLMANHGMVTAGRDLKHAMALAVELETLAKQYYFASQLDDMKILPDDEMDNVLEGFKNYGKPIKT